MSNEWLRAKVLCQSVFNYLNAVSEVGWKRSIKSLFWGGFNIAVKYNKWQIVLSGQSKYGLKNSISCK